MLLSQLRNNLTWHQFVAPGLDDTSEEPKPKPKTSFPTFNEESRDLMHLHLRVKVVSMYFQVRTAIVLSDVSDEITPTHKSGHER